MATTEEWATGTFARAGALDRDTRAVDRLGVLGVLAILAVLVVLVVLWGCTRGADALTWAWYAARASDREIRETC